MLKPIKTKTARASGGTFAIVASRYNAEFVDAMRHAAREEFCAPERGRSPSAALPAGRV